MGGRFLIWLWDWHMNHDEVMFLCQIDKLEAKKKEFGDTQFIGQQCISDVCLTSNSLMINISMKPSIHTLSFQNFLKTKSK